jgi:hypothetical protein
VILHLFILMSLIRTCAIQEIRVYKLFTGITMVLKRGGVNTHMLELRQCSFLLFVDWVSNVLQLESS